MAAPFSIETGYPAATDVQSAFPAHETAFRQTVNDWLSSFSDPATGLLLPAALDPFLDTANTWTATQTFADMVASGDVSVTGNATIGGTLDVTGAVTLAAVSMGVLSATSISTTGSIVAGGSLQANQNVQSGTAALVLAAGTTSGTIYLRPQGPSSSTGQAVIAANGDMSITGDLTVSGGNITGTASGNVPNARSVTAGNGLTGGGALSSNITLNVGAGTGITVASDTVGVSADVWRDGNKPSLAQVGVVDDSTGYVDKTAARAVNTSYHNTKATPIEVYARIDDGGGNVNIGIDVSSNNTTWVVLEYVRTGDNNHADLFIHARILPGYYYKVTATEGGTLTSWIEVG